MSGVLRQLPSVNRLVEAVACALDGAEVSHSLIVAAARQMIDAERDRLTADGSAAAMAIEYLTAQVVQHVRTLSRPPLRPAINATGVIVHTGLGRAPLASRVAAQLAEVAASYAPVELDMDLGERGRRADVVRELLCELTGAESATVVNNNAAALMIVLNTIARERSVIVSRGELIEIGGSFRLPEVIHAGQAVLREVGTTNRTRLADYEQAIDDHAAAILRAHTSNYRIEGFTESVDTTLLATLAHQHDLPMVDDIGSGLLYPIDHEALHNEPDARSAVQAGADLVLFSGDKLLGGPQAGVIVGRATLIDRIERNPMMRALRVDKLTLASLGMTLQLWRDPDRLIERHPVMAMLHASMAELKRRAAAIMNTVGSLPEGAELSIETSRAYIGGGSAPTQAIESIALRLKSGGRSASDIAARLRQGDPPVVGRVHDDALWLDLRTVFPTQDERLQQLLPGIMRHRG